MAEGKEAARPFEGLSVGKLQKELDRTGQNLSGARSRNDSEKIAALEQRANDIRDEIALRANGQVDGVAKAAPAVAPTVTRPPERRLVEPTRPPLVDGRGQPFRPPEQTRGPVRRAVDAAVSRVTGPRISMTENQPPIPKPAPVAQGRGATGPWGLEAELAGLDDADQQAM